ncbi:MAG: hypothetical protein JW786_04275 [Desulfobacterales bacterium]|nr:hypothetical protein [Desulfobacterales bacterium]
MTVDFEKNILSPEEVAWFFRKSISWVYKNWRKLGGRKLGGSLFFPGKEDLSMSCYFVKGKGWRYAFTLQGARHIKGWFETKREPDRRKQTEGRK